jgi:hypothetical protein
MRPGSRCATLMLVLALALTLLTLPVSALAAGLPPNEGLGWESLANPVTGELYSRQRSNRYLADELVSPSNAWSLTPLGHQVTQQIAPSTSNAERTS